MNFIDYTATKMEFFSSVDHQICRICLKMPPEVILTKRDFTVFNAYFGGFMDVNLPDTYACAFCWQKSKQCLKYLQTVQNSNKMWQKILQDKELNKNEILKTNLSLVKLKKKTLNCETFSESFPVETFTENPSIFYDSDHVNSDSESVDNKIYFPPHETLKYEIDENHINIDPNYGHVEIKEEILVDDVPETFIEPLNIPYKQLNSKSEEVPKRVQKSVRINEKTIKKLKSLNFSLVFLSEREQIRWIKSLKRKPRYMNAEYKCPMCYWNGRTKENFHTHMEKHSEAQGPIVCQMCRMRFKDKITLALHKNVHAYQYRCMKCDRVVPHMSKCQRHYDACSVRGQTTKCPHCKKVLKSELCMKKHISKEHLNLVKFTCDYCKKSSKSKRIIRNHIKRVHMNYRYPCPICGKEIRADLMDPHKQSHENFEKDETTYCVECDKHFRDLQGHYKRSAKHAKKEPKFGCDMCSMQFLARYLLKKHKNAVHFKLETHCCQLCPKKYSNLSALSKHMMDRHTENKASKNFTCFVCGKSFAEKRSLQDHTNTHTNKRPYQCKLCPAAFNFNSGLKTHTKKHHGPKPEGPKEKQFICNRCGKGFMTKATLRDHTYSHTNERPYKCEICMATFNFQSALRTHKKIKHQGFKLKKRAPKSKINKPAEQYHLQLQE